MRAAPETRPPGLRSVDARAYGGDLLALLLEMRGALQARGEGLPLDWPETARDEIKAGRMPAWVFEGDGPTLGLAILAVRRDRGFGQLHVRGPPSSSGLARGTLTEIRSRQPATIRRTDLAVSAEPNETELAWGQVLDDPRSELPFVVIRRRALVRPLLPASPPPNPELPPGFRFGHAVALGAAALAPIDFESFAGGPDAGMVAETREDNERLLQGLLDGDLGSPIPEASPALWRDRSTGGPELVGFALHLEESPGEALLADIALLPGVRRKGLGRALLLRALRGLQALNYRRSRLWVTDTNLPARALYERLGYEQERTGRILRWEADRRAGPPT